jgi:hypothetical protein
MGKSECLLQPDLLAFWASLGSDGTLFAGDGMSIAAIAPDGRRYRSGMLLDEGFPGFIRGVAAGPGGSLYVTTSAGNVASYHPGTRAAQTWQLASTNCSVLPAQRMARRS